MRASFLMQMKRVGLSAPSLPLRPRFSPRFFPSSPPFASSNRARRRRTNDLLYSAGRNCDWALVN